MNYAAAYAAACYARVPHEEIHSDLLHAQPSGLQIRQTVTDYLGEDHPHTAQLHSLVPDDQTPLSDEAVRPLREETDRLGVRFLRTLLRPRPTRLGTFLQTLAKGDRDPNLTSLAGAVLRNPHEETHAHALSDYLHEIDHPAADAVDWTNLSRGLRLEDLVRRSLRSRGEWHGDLAAVGSTGANARLANYVRIDARLFGHPDLNDASDAELRDAAVRIVTAEKENVRVNARWWLHPGLNATAGTRRRRANLYWGQERPEWRAAVETAHRFLRR